MYGCNWNKCTSVKFTVAYDIKAEIPGGVSRYNVAHACGPLAIVFLKIYCYALISINLPMYSVCENNDVLTCTQSRFMKWINCYMSNTKPICLSVMQLRANMSNEPGFIDSWGGAGWMHWCSVTVTNPAKWLCHVFYINMKHWYVNTDTSVTLWWKLEK